MLESTCFRDHGESAEEDEHPTELVTLDDMAVGSPSEKGLKHLEHGPAGKRVIHRSVSVDVASDAMPALKPARPEAPAREPPPRPEQPAPTREPPARPAAPAVAATPTKDAPKPERPALPQGKPVASESHQLPTIAAVASAAEARVSPATVDHAKPAIVAPKPKPPVPSKKPKLTDLVSEE